MAVARRRETQGEARAGTPRRGGARLFRGSRPRRVRRSPRDEARTFEPFARLLFGVAQEKGGGPAATSTAARLLLAVAPSLVTAAGVLALLMVACAALNVHCGALGLALGVALPALGSAAARLLGRGGLGGVCAAFAADAAVLYLARDAFLAQAQVVAQSAWMGGMLWDAGLAGQTVPWAAAAVGSVLFLVLYLLLFCAPLAWLARVALIALVVAQDAVGLDLPWGELACAAFCVVGSAPVRQLTAPRRGEGRAPAAPRASAGVAVAVLACAVAAALLLPAAYQGLQGTPALSRAVAQATRLTSRAHALLGLDAATSAGAATAATGAVSRGNNYATGTAWLTVYAFAEPTDTVYLKQFTGGAYVGDGWAEDDADLGAYMRENAARSRVAVRHVANVQRDALEAWAVEEAGVSGGGGADSAGSGAYPATDSTAGLDLGSRSLERTFEALCGSVRTVGVEVIDGLGGGEQPTPYYARFRGDEDGCREYTCFSAQEALEAPAALSGLQARQYAERLRVLEAFAQENYLAVPTELLPQLTQLAAENPVDGGDALAAVDTVRQLLADRAVYTRTPGEAQGSGDIVEEFLFSRHAGYCQQFASAAALLLRLYGVPARYASGYAAPARLFRPGLPAAATGGAANAGDQNGSAEEVGEQDGGAAGALGGVTGETGEQGRGTADTAGGYQATLSDLQQHAWVEVFVSGVGWVPVEVTPAATSAAPEDAPATSVEEAEPVEVPDPAAAEDAKAGSEAAETGENDEASAGAAGNTAAADPLASVLAAATGAVAALWRSAPVRVVLAALAAAASCVTAVAACRAAAQTRVARLAPDALLAQLMRVLRRCGLVTGCASGYEPSFAAALADEVKGGDAQDVAAHEALRAAAQRLVDLAGKQAFSPEGATGEERTEALRCYRRVGAALMAAGFPGASRPKARLSVRARVRWALWARVLSGW